MLFVYLFLKQNKKHIFDTLKQKYHCEGVLLSLVIIFISDFLILDKKLVTTLACFQIGGCFSCQKRLDQ